MGLRVTNILCLLLLGTTLMQGTVAFADDTRVVVPIKQTVLSDGTKRYSIPVQIGDSTPFDAMLDTGSSGLRVLPGTLSESEYQISQEPNEYHYESGVRLNGFVAQAKVRIGDVSTNQRIPIQIVQKVDCVPHKPDCPASRISMDDYRLGGNGLSQQGFKAIIGVRFPILSGPPNAIVNPLVWMGQARWIVKLPLPGQTKPGELIIDPDDTDLVGMTIFRNLVDVPELDKKAMNGCLFNQSTGRRFCGPVFFDSGADGMTIYTSLVPPRRWGEGMQGLLTLQNDDSSNLSISFAIGRDHVGTGVEIIAGPPRYQAVVSAGVLPYFSYEVLYDTPNKWIGLKLRSQETD